MIVQGVRALNSRIGKLTNLTTIEPAPPPTIELVVKRSNELRLDEVYERIPHVAVVERVDRQV
jgi:hypothetical protein